MGRVILPAGVRSVHRPVDKPFRCLLCGESFTASQQGLWTDHVARCAVEHAQEIQDSRPSARERGGPFDPQTWDVEYEAWLAALGQKMIREHRLERKPNEC